MASAEVNPNSPIPNDVDPVETNEWLESLDYVLEHHGPERAKELLAALEAAAVRNGVELPFTATTPYVNTIAPTEQPPYPGDRELERRIKSYVRWNAMAMVVRANRDPASPGGHISTFASSATLYEVALNHFIRGRGEDGFSGDQVYYQGHAAPGMYSRAFLEGRLTEQNLVNFRREMGEGGGLSSYPHPWLMPGFWEFPTVSMGLAPIMAIYQARFNEYLTDRGIKDCKDKRVWAFLGDGECDEPETLGAIGLAAREHLDNLTFVINCNLQRLDGPVRGNSKIIQELEGTFRGAGWNVIKVIWGDGWDRLIAEDHNGLLAKRMMEVVDGEYQKYVVAGGAYIREKFFGKYPELLERVKHLSDQQIEKLNRGGHDPAKVYAAYSKACERNGKPTVVIAKTIKGYGLGEAGEGRMVTHNNKKLNENELVEFRTRFGIPISDERVTEAPFYRPPEDSPEMNYLRERREAMGGSVPSRNGDAAPIEVPELAEYDKTLAKMTSKGPGKEMSTTQGFVRLLSDLLRDKKIGKRIVPIVPDESRTFGMEGLFRQIGIYAHAGQLYEPVDADQLSYYKEAQDGQLLEEGITEAGSMSSFNAAGTAYSSHGEQMIPMYIYYSMFGFQRIGDLVWAAADMRAKGFMLGGTAGRTTLNGEGLQHQDGHSLVNAIAFPTVRAYDPAYNYETAVIIFHGLQKMYVENEQCIFYLMLENENVMMPQMPEVEGIDEGIIKGMYKLKSTEGGQHRVQLFGSGSILHGVLDAQQILAEKYGVSSDVWSVTSYTELRRDAQETERLNMLNPTAPKKQSFFEQQMAGSEGPIIAASDYLRTLSEQLAPWAPNGMFCLGTDGMGRSESRENLRRHFEVDAASVVIATLWKLSKEGKIDASVVDQAINDLDYDREKASPLYA
ncbi:Pyruvate dehydrogenase E1 component [Planctomycetes bacterium MalM25]|nr:Pyruvate dehydrogenase E1 component [Planctomycetes bacterium MalM25]